jgi:hypothetical protein
MQNKNFTSSMSGKVFHAPFWNYIRIARPGNALKINTTGLPRSYSAIQHCKAIPESNADLVVVNTRSTHF